MNVVAHNSLAVGDTVRIAIPADHDLMTTQWWPKTGATTGTVQKLFKNGQIAVAVHQLRNRSADGFRTLQFSAESLEKVS